MDPNETRASMLQLAKRIASNAEYVYCIGTDDALALAELFLALDQWITGGGFLPLAWENTHHE